MKRFVSMSLLAAAVVASLSTSPVMADTPGRHPHYVQALNDLNQAHAILTAYRYPDGSDQAWADKECRFATREVLRAAWNDDKNTSVVTPPDVNMNRRDVLRQARALLQGARRDLQFQEDNPGNYGWRQGALDHVNRALNYLNRAIRVDGQ